jgi:hypothetical protein
MQKRRPQRTRNLNNARIGQELREIAPDRGGRRRVRGAEIDQQNAQSRRAIVRK